MKSELFQVFVHRTRKGPFVKIAQTIPGITIRTKAANFAIVTPKVPKVPNAMFVLAIAPVLKNSQVANAIAASLDFSISLLVNRAAAINLGRGRRLAEKPIAPVTKTDNALAKKMSAL